MRHQLVVSRSPDQRYWLTLANETSDAMVEVTQQQAEQIALFLGGRASRSPLLHPRAYIRYPYPDEPGRFDLEINGDPTEHLADGAPFNDLQFFRCLDGRIFAVAFPAPDDAVAYQLVPVEVYHQD